MILFSYSRVLVPFSIRFLSVLSGESGSGKTEATKIILKYLSFASQYEAHKPNAQPKSTDMMQTDVTAKMAPNTEVTAEEASQGRANLVERKLIESNPVIEAFGNAKTIRNNNSSRFVSLCTTTL